MDKFGEIESKVVAVGTMGETLSKCCSAPKKEDVRANKDELRPEPDGYGKPKSYNGLAPGALVTTNVATAEAVPPSLPPSLPTQGENEYIVQEDSALIAIQVEGLKLAGCSAKYLAPEKLKECKDNKPKFTFGRSESKVEELPYRSILIQTDCHPAFPFGFFRLDLLPHLCPPRWSHCSEELNSM